MIGVKVSSVLNHSDNCDCVQCAGRCHSTKMQSQTLEEAERKVPESYLPAGFANKLGINVGNDRFHLL